MNAWILPIIMGVVGIYLLSQVYMKNFKAKGMGRNLAILFGSIFVIYAIVGALGPGAGLFEVPDFASGIYLSTATVANGVECASGQVLVNGVCKNQNSGVTTYQPTGTYSAIDKFSATTSVSGTSYYKRGDGKATTTQASNLNEGEQITYWVDNNTYYVQPEVKTAGSSVTDFVAEGYANSSATLTLYDQVARKTVTSGDNNVTLSANGLANIELTYQGTAEGSSGPFGGVIVAEYVNTIASVTCSGSEITSSNPYHVTYSASNVSHTFNQFAYTPGLDDGSGDVKRINCQFKAGGTGPGSASPFIFTVIPANYYVADSGDIVLDTEKFANGANTRTALASPTVTGYWA